MITLKEFLMGRESMYPLDMEKALNAASLLASINYVRGIYSKPLTVSSGYRPGHFNKQAGGASKSSHLMCQAVDLFDPKKEFANWCLANLDVLERAGLYLEDPVHTPNWVHLQTRKPGSGKRIFKP